MTRNDDIRKEVLMQLYAVRPLALSAERIQRDAKKAGYDYSVSEINAELQFLVDRSLAFQITDAMGTAHLYRIHAIGVTQYEQTYAS